jgi:hypothetical protein
MEQIRHLFLSEFLVGTLKPEPFFWECNSFFTAINIFSTCSDAIVTLE